MKFDSKLLVLAVSLSALHSIGCAKSINDSADAVANSWSKALGGSNEHIATTPPEPEGDRGFRYDRESGRCIDKDKKEGFNREYLGECGTVTGNSRPGYTLAHANLSGKNLKGASIMVALDAADLSNADLEGFAPTLTSLKNASFNGANLTGANFFAAKDVTGASFKGAHLDRANFVFANLDGADFTGADASKAQFDNASLKGSTFNGAKIYNSSFSHAVLDGASFNSATLSHVDFWGASALKTDFTKSELEAPEFRDADLGGANLCGARPANDWAGPPTSLANAKSLAKAKFDAKTLLPFDRTSAESRGMVYSE